MTDPRASAEIGLDEVAIIRLDGDTVEVEHVTPDAQRPLSTPTKTPFTGLTRAEPSQLRVGPVGTLLASLLGTILLAGPLLWAARDVESPPNVIGPESLVVITTDTDLQPLHESTVSKRALISFIGDDIEAVAFTLANADGAIVSERIDGLAPEFDFLTDGSDEPLALDTRKLDNGAYELLVTATTIDEESIYTAAQFEVVNR